MIRMEMRNKDMTNAGAIHAHCFSIFSGYQQFFPRRKDNNSRQIQSDRKIPGRLSTDHSAANRYTES